MSKMYIEIDKKNIVWLKEGRNTLMGYESLSQLERELNGIFNRC